MRRLIEGEPAPWFIAPTHVNPKFSFSSVAGRYVLLGFLPTEPAARAAAVAAVQAQRPRLDDQQICGFLIERDREAWAATQDGPGLRWFLDEDGAVSRLYGALDDDGQAAPKWLLLDPQLRILAGAPIGDLRVLEELARLPEVDAHAGATLHAPVLVIPRIFEPAICRRLIDLYEADGGAASGVMREIDGRTVGVLDDFKRRRDATVEDDTFRAELKARIARRLLPEIARAFQFQVTRIERYIVACYDAADGGYFRPHRDNTTKGTAHRRFAVSINLNAEAHEGGDLRFPEFGRRTYRPPTGGAVVFSCSLLHEATPVTKGRRYAFLPFLYDEAAAKIRDENLKYLAAEPQSAA